MGQIAITMNGRFYHLACEGGDEQRLAMIGNHIQATLDRLVSDFGQIGESRLLLMAAATITDELMDFRETSAPDAGYGGDSEGQVAVSDDSQRRANSG